MNNKRILIVGVLAVIVTLMVGYALFSETISINGTATAKGDFSITTTCQMGLPSDSIYNFARTYAEKYGYTEGGYDNDYCTVNGNNVSFGADLKYPGAARFFTIFMKNTGSIMWYPTDFSTEVEICGDEDRDDVIDTCDTVSSAAGNFDLIGFIKEDGTIVDFNNDESDEFYQYSVDECVIKPGQSMILVGISNWDESLDTEDYNNRLFKLGYTTTMDVKQYND